MHRVVVLLLASIFISGLAMGMSLTLIVLRATGRLD